MKEFIYSIYLGTTDWADAVWKLDDFKWTEASPCEDKMENKSFDHQGEHHKNTSGSFTIQDLWN